MAGAPVCVVGRVPPPRPDTGSVHRPTDADEHRLCGWKCPGSHTGASEYFLPQVMSSRPAQPITGPTALPESDQASATSGCWRRGPCALASLYNLTFSGTPGTGVTPTSRPIELVPRLPARASTEKGLETSLPVPPFTGSFYRVHSPRQGSGWTEEEPVQDRQPRLCSVQAPAEPLGPRAALHGT